MGLLETLRRWVDGDDNEDALSRAAAEQARPRRQAEQFIVTIARSIGEVMQAEAVPMPPDQTVIPPEYVVFLSEEDDREWQGMKRRALEQGLYHVLAEHARDLAGKTKLATTSFSVELRVDGTLEKGEVRVQHSWEESSSVNKTSITPRGVKAAAPSSPQTQQPQVPALQTASPPLPQHQTPPSPFNQPAAAAPPLQASSQVAPTMMVPGGVGAVVTGAETNDSYNPITAKTNTSSGALDNEATQVRKRELYRLEIWRNNQRQTVMPIYDSQISIGRKSQKIASDVQLEGDAEVSRPHAVLTRDAEGKYWLIHKGKNPTLIGGREAPANQPTPVAPGEPIAICSFLLRIQ
jgi:hypothetical protein